MRNGLILFALATIFVLARVYIAPDTLITVLNGLFVGALVALLLVLRSLTWNAIRGRLRYADVSLFTLGLMLWLAGTVFGVLSSIYVRAISAALTSVTLTAMARYSVIWAFLIMAYSPDAGLGFFEGRDRKAVIASVTAGIAVAIAVIYVQAFEVFA